MPGTTLSEPGYVVHCGTTNLPIGEPYFTWTGACACAAWHRDGHGCVPWIEPPLDGAP